MRTYLRLWRQFRALTQAELGERAGISRITVNRIERTSCENYAATRRALADALGITPEDLYRKPDAADVERKAS